jgi:hypothetical protein
MFMTYVRLEYAGRSCHIGCGVTRSRQNAGACQRPGVMGRQRAEDQQPEFSRSRGS